MEMEIKSFLTSKSFDMELCLRNSELEKKALLYYFWMEI